MSGCDPWKPYLLLCSVFVLLIWQLGKTLSLAAGGGRDPRETVGAIRVGLPGRHLDGGPTDTFLRDCLHLLPFLLPAAALPHSPHQLPGFPRATPVVVEVWLLTWDRGIH